MAGTRFLFSTKTSLGGQKIKFQHKSPWMSKSTESSLTAMVQRSKLLLSHTIADSYHAPRREVVDFANRYFLTSPAPSAGEWRTILAKLELTYNGLSVDLSLKLGADGAYGYVGFVGGRPGTVHLSKKRALADPNIGVIALIHESTHKFAQTEDGIPTDTECGYRENDDSDWWHAGLDKANALNNADSYAWFAYQVGGLRGL